MPVSSLLLRPLPDISLATRNLAPLSHQERWEDFLQPAVYTHNVSPIPGTDQISPFFLVFERHAPEIIPNDLPPATLSRNAYAELLVSRLWEAQKQFNTIKADLKGTQGEYYDKSSRDLAIPPSSRNEKSATRFIRRFDGPYNVLGQVHGRLDLLRLQHKFTKEELKTAIKKIIVVPDEQLESSTDLRDSDENIKRHRDCSYI